MKLDIHPDTEFSTGNTAKMLGIEGLTPQRIKMLCVRGLIPASKGGAKQSHFNIKFRDFDKVVEAHQSHRSISKGPKYPSMEQFTELRQDVDSMNRTIGELLEQIRLLEGLYEIDNEKAEA